MGPRLSEDHLSESAARDDGTGAPDSGDARRRLALTRVLIWAEREAASMARPDVSEALKQAIVVLHSDLHSDSEG